MTYFYESSSVFGSLKAIEEHIKWNPSTEQYLNTLDTLLHHGLYAILCSCNYADQQIASMLAWYAESSRHRITSVEKGEALSLMGAFLLTRDPDEKMALYEALRPRRTLTFIIIDDWLTAVKDYRRLMNTCLKSPDDMLTRNTVRGIECAVGYDCERHTDLYAACAQVKYWSEAAASFKQMIMEKYVRLILTKSRQFYQDTGHAFQLDDIVQTNCMLALKAIDRCDQRKGTLTTYLETWLNGSRMRKVLVERDSAFSAGSNQSDFKYKTVFLTDDDLEDVVAATTDTNHDDVAHVQKIAHMVDPTGLGRLSLDIGQYSGVLLKSGRL